MSPAASSGVADPSDSTASVSAAGSSAAALIGERTSSEQAVTGSSISDAEIDYSITGSYTGRSDTDPTLAAQDTVHESSTSDPGLTASSAGYHTTTSVSHILQGSTQGLQSGSPVLLSSSIVQDTTSVVATSSQLSPALSTSPLVSDSTVVIQTGSNDGATKSSTLVAAQDSAAGVSTSSQVVEGDSTVPATATTFNPTESPSGTIPVQGEAHHYYMPIAPLLVVVIVILNLFV